MHVDYEAQEGISSLKAANFNKISQVLLNSRVDGQNWAEVLTVIRWNRGTWMVWMKNHLSEAGSIWFLFSPLFFCDVDVRYFEALFQINEFEKSVVCQL